MLTVEQVLATNKANVETLFGLTGKASKAWKSWLN